MEYLREGDVRLIPAHAGKTFAAALPRPLVTAHPRSRGENDNQLPSKEVQAGSSPLTRGKREGVPIHVNGGGLIPAHAGKTSITPRYQPRTTAHPRSRGENNCVG